MSCLVFGLNILLANEEALKFKKKPCTGSTKDPIKLILSIQMNIRPVVPALQIIDLPINTAYIKLAEEGSVEKVILK